MQQFIDLVVKSILALPPLETVSVVLAVVYLVLVIRENIWCWAAGLVSVLLSFVVFWEARLYMEATLQIFYAGMSVYGWYEWRYGGAKKGELPIALWSATTHVIAILATGVATIICGYFLMKYTNEAKPFVDSFTTIGALVATFMVARKVLENWIYWFVIDAVSAYLYVSRELYLFAALFVIYLVMIVIGFNTWMKQWRAECAAADADAKKVMKDVQWQRDGSAPTTEQDANSKAVTKNLQGARLDA